MARTLHNVIQKLRASILMKILTCICKISADTNNIHVNDCTPKKKLLFIFPGLTQELHFARNSVVGIRDV